MADPRDVARRLMPNASPEVIDSWVSQNASPAAPPPSFAIPPNTLPSFARPITIPGVNAPQAPPPPPPDAMSAAITAANGRPHGAPPPAAPPPSLFDQRFTPRSEGPPMDLGLGPPTAFLGGVAGGLDALAGNNARGVAKSGPGQVTDTPPDWAKRAADARQPRGGDWKGHNEYLDRKDAKERLDNLNGATFMDPPASLGGAPGGAAALGTLISKGGRTPASWTEQTQQGVRFSEDTEKAADKADESQRDAARWGMLAGTAEAEREMAYLDRHSQLQEDHALRMRRRADAQQSQYRDELGKLQAMNEAAQADKIPTDAWFVKRDGDGSVNQAASWTSAIGYVLGGISQGLLHLPENPINSHIRDQIETSKYNAQLKRQKLEDQRSLLGQMMRTFGDERQAEEGAWLAYLEKAKTDMGRIVAESKHDGVQANYRNALAAIDKEWAVHKQRWDELTQDKVMRTQHDVNAAPVYAGGGVALGKHDREEIGKVSEALEKAGIPQAYAQLQDVDHLINSFEKGDLPGISATADSVMGITGKDIQDHLLTATAGLGPAAKLLPKEAPFGAVAGRAIYGDRAVATRQAVASIKNGIRKSIAGASLTEGEKKELDKQLEGSHDSESLRRTVQAFRRSLSYRSRNIMSGASDVARAEFARRYGSVPTEDGPFNVPLDRGAAPYVREAK